ncbi:LLM class flavin-dependent oxidoreductase [Aldersonia sp. NBC_00410]|uniref:LLM class flavin-dependent oxidoreductase n=1 Tax=Aldersonia sp. NBC_00410 TaxID=2975954 RepID=UPI00224FA757|nr:LLM class flavin-dependent oxidoreductase [Aldersonia sp. NBC_00410]MCX5045680.1 LLM class flavin-dependent oxidoreductase [Aldersonia sp. NBC_00410]
MSRSNRQLHLNAFLWGVGQHEAAWRHPLTTASDVLNVAHYQNLGRIAERGKLDSLFFADALQVDSRIKHNSLFLLDPVTLLSAIAVATERIGLIGTASTTYSDPYTTARRFATLDHISGGRAGWNIVTGHQPEEAANFGLDALPTHSERYERGAEFIDVALELWDSWEDDALRLDVESGVFADPDKLHPIDHDGAHFRVRGPLSSPRSLQGRPLLVQAGSSETGKDFAARYAEAVFTAQYTLEQGQEFYRDLKARVVKAGRSADELKILPGFYPFIADTEEEARALEQSFNDLKSTEFALEQLSRIVGVELDEDSLDFPLPALPSVEDFDGQKSRLQLVQDLAGDGKHTVRELIGLLAGGRGHRTIVGTPEQVADEIELWFTERAADGFNVMPPYLPGGLEDFVDRVVPILQQRGLFRTEYTATTLRGHFGLADAGSRFATAQATA